MYPSNIRKIIIVTFCQRFHLYIHAYVLLLQSRGLTLLQISTIESVVIGTIFLMEVPTGVLADRVGRKWSILLSTFLLLIAESIFLFARDYPLYILMAVVTGTGHAFASGAIDALVYDSLPKENRDQAMKRTMGQVGSMGQIAFFIAPILGAIIIGDAAPERFIPAIALTVLALFIGLLVGFTLEEPASDWEAERPSTLATFQHGIRDMATNKQLRQIVLLVVFTIPFTATLITTLAAPYLTANDVSPFMVGMAFSIGSLLAAFTQRYAYVLEQILGKRLTLQLLILLPGVMYWLLAIIAGPVPTFLIVTFMYATNDMKAPLFSAYQNALIDSRSRATVLSLINMFVNLFIAVGAPIYAALAMESFQATFLLMGGVILLAGIVIPRPSESQTVESAIQA